MARPEGISAATVELNVISARRGSSPLRPPSIINGTAGPAVSPLPLSAHVHTIRVNEGGAPSFSADYGERALSSNKSLCSNAKHCSRATGPKLRGRSSLHQFLSLPYEKLLFLNFPVLKVHRAPTIDAVFVFKWKDAYFATPSRSPHRSAGARSCRDKKIFSKVN